jgi:hypothetical protein
MACITGRYAYINSNKFLDMRIYLNPEGRNYDHHALKFTYY